MLNTISLEGRLVRDVEVIKVGTASVAKFSIAVGRNYKAKDGTYPTDFIPVELWGDKLPSMMAENVGKGDKVTVNGSLYMNNYTNKEGNEIHSFIVRANNVWFDFKKRENPVKEDKADSIDVDDAAMGLEF